jgi:hypothetical protein
MGTIIAPRKQASNARGREFGLQPIDVCPWHSSVAGVITVAVLAATAVRNAASTVRPWLSGKEVRPASSPAALSNRTIFPTFGGPLWRV